MTRIRKGFYDILKSIDYFAKPINFTYKGNDTYRTAFGGFMSTIIGTFLGVIFVYKVIAMYERSETKIRKDSIVSISNTYNEPQLIGEKGISLMFMLSDLNGIPLTYEKEIGQFSLWQGKFQLIELPNGKITRQFSKQIIPYSRCTLQSLALSRLNREDILQYPIDDYYCPEWTNLTLQGNFHAPQFQFLYLEFIKCTSKSLCSNSTLLKKRIESSYIQLIPVSSFFDVQNYVQPIKHFMDDAFYPMVDNMNIFATMLFRQSNIELADSLNGFYEEPFEDVFYQMSTLSQVIQSLELTGGSLFSLQIQLDKFIDRYNRQVYTFNDVLQELGGFQSILFLIIAILYSGIQDSKFQLSMARNLFLIQDYKKMMNENSEDSNDDEAPDDTIRSKSEIKSKRALSGIQKLKESLKTVLMTNSKDAKDMVLSKMFDYIKIRKNMTFKYKYLFRSVINDMFGWMICNCCKKESKILKIKRKDLLEKGKNKVMDELDCTSMIRRMRMVDNLAQLLLSVPQQILLYNQKKDVIHVNESSEDEELLNLKNVRKIQRNIKLFSAFAYYKIKDQLTTIDKRIIMGTISNNPHFLDKELLESAISQKIKLMTKATLKNKEIKKVEDLDVYADMQKEIQAYQSNKSHTFAPTQSRKVDESSKKARGVTVNSRKSNNNLPFINDIEQNLTQREESRFKTDSSEDIKSIEAQEKNARQTLTIEGKIFSNEKSKKVFKEDLSITEIEDPKQTNKNIKNIIVSPTRFSEIKRSNSSTNNNSTPQKSHKKLIDNQNHN
ncbi:UNKNOWN [Stylonychia lemnae]|uniref:Transmembrane protein n=1 Tax=Stylonychia lemnae TaxID=5949 RepID=A0A078AJ51_STYLE|nr:UNKNOWN [Stylonychia lemnae]|eukprot:CDW81502.1 UNKNOWN [Stylonychia lemnae]